MVVPLFMNMSRKTAAANFQPGDWHMTETMLYVALCKLCYVGTCKVNERSDEMRKTVLV